MTSKNATFGRRIRFGGEDDVWKKLTESFPSGTSCSRTIGEDTGSVTFRGETEDGAATSYYKWATSNGITISADTFQGTDYLSN